MMILKAAAAILISISLAQCIKLPLKSGQIGNRMVTMDSEDNRVKLACVNWYGAHMEDMVVNGD